MEKNVGLADKVVRILAAIALAVLLFTDAVSGTLAWVLGVVSIVLLVTSVIGFCPLYRLLGISTSSKKGPQPAAH